jgi:predicted Zn finger-like uncharacterized protein
LFTQCSNCDTVFRLSAETLRAAGGQVRCGRCGEIFNALARLAEDASVFPRRESAIEMEKRADEILQSSSLPGDRPPGTPSRPETASRLELAANPAVAPSPEPAAHPAIVPSPEPAAHPAIVPRPRPAANPAAGAKPEIAANPAIIAKPEPAAKPAVAPQKGEASSDVSAPAQIAVARAAPENAHSASAAAPPDAAHDAPFEEDSAFEFTLPPGELDRVFVEVAPRSRSAIPAAALALSEAAAENLAGPVSESRGHRVSGFEVSEDVRREMLDGFESQPLLELAASPPRPRSFFVWLGAAIALALLLSGQMIRENRGWLAQHAPLRGPLRSLYAVIGVAVQMPANVSAYQLRQWGVTGDPTAAGTLRVRASILNTAPQLQPYPLLRVTLANRFGARIGTRDFEPAEYLGKPTVRMLAPGERADATLDILDPGKDAEGFEIDVCLRGADQKISCASDVAPQGTP